MRDILLSIMNENDGNHCKVIIVIRKSIGYLLNSMCIDFFV
jgi:hypothetical protein